VGRPVILSNPVITSTALGGVGSGPVGIGGAGGILATGAGLDDGVGNPFGSGVGAVGADGDAVSFCDGANAAGDVCCSVPVPLSPDDGVADVSDGGVAGGGLKFVCASATAPPTPASARQQMSARIRLLKDQDPLATAPDH
jgi:hypothetical protein